MKSLLFLLDLLTADEPAQIRCGHIVSTRKRCLSPTGVGEGRGEGARASRHGEVQEEPNEQMVGFTTIDAPLLMNRKKIGPLAKRMLVKAQAGSNASFNVRKMKFFLKNFLENFAQKDDVFKQ